MYLHCLMIYQNIPMLLQNILQFSTAKRIWACLMCKCLSKCLHMGAQKDYLKLIILLSPNETYVYIIDVAFHHHLITKKFHLKYLVSLKSKESPVDWRVSNFLFPLCLLVKRSMTVVCLLLVNVGHYLMWRRRRLHLVRIIYFIVSTLLQNSKSSYQK